MAGRDPILEDLLRTARRQNALLFAILLLAVAYFAVLLQQDAFVVEPEIVAIGLGTFMFLLPVLSLHGWANRRPVLGTALAQSGSVACRGSCRHTRHAMPSIIGKRARRAIENAIETVRDSWRRRGRRDQSTGGAVSVEVSATGVPLSAPGW